MTRGGRVRELLDQGTALAVTGMAVRFPGARNVRRYWANLRDGVESIRDLDAQELLSRGVPGELLDDPAYVRRGAVLDGMDRFDAGFFGFSPRDAAILDPQHRHFLETAWEALEDAGHVPGRIESSVGVFAGSGTNAYFWTNLLTNPELVREVGYFLLRHTGNDKDFLSTRVSYQFDLKGPSVNVQTACSTSLVAVHMAAQSLLSGECDMALAGGVTIEQPHGHGYLFREREILSPDGRCRPFDASAGGTVFGSGVGVVVLRRLEDAVREGDQIHALLLGSAVNNDGSLKVGYLAPSVDGQARAIAEALGVADVDPATFGFIAAHGTGTAVGDPIEVEALTRAFRSGTDRRGYCALGSVKANIGHADTAAGVASLVQAVCALRAREIPPLVHFREPNPGLSLEDSPFRIPGALEPWDADGPRRAGVNSLGVGGTNAFAILEEAPELAPGPSGGRKTKVFPVSARSPRALEAACGDLADHLDGDLSPDLSDAAYTLAVGRRAFRHRRVVVGGSREEVVEGLLTRDPSRVVTSEVLEPTPGVTFLFAGGGSQYPGMGRGLRGSEPAYREVVEDCLGMLDPELSGQVRAFLDDALGPDGDGDAERPRVALPALFITQLAHAQHWISQGIRPSALLGHSMGEYTAACLSGVLSRADALTMVVNRGRLFEELPPGGMVSVELPEDTLRARLPRGLSVAAVNAPDLVAASGPLPLVEELEARLRSEGVEHRRIRISVAAHSAMLDPILAPFKEVLRRVELHPPRIPFPSNLSGRWITPEEATSPEYWVRQLRETVRFADGIRAVTRKGSGILLEVGPGRTLATLAKLSLAPDAAFETVTSMRHPGEEGDDAHRHLAALGRVWCLGAEVNWDPFHSGEARRRVSLPTYPFEGERHFFEPGRAFALAPDAGGAAESSPGSALDGFFHVPTWEPAPLEEEVDPEGDAGVEEGPILLVTTDPAGARSRLPGLPDGSILVALGTGAEAGVEAEAGLEAGAASGADEAFLADGADLAGWGHLLRRLDDEGRRPRAVVYLPLAEPALGPGPGPEHLAFDTLRTLVRALGEDEAGTALRLLVLTSGMCRVMPGDPVDPWKSLALGPVRVAPREFPWIRARAVDVGPLDGAGGPGLARILLSEIEAPEARPLVAWRGEGRFAPAHAPLPKPASGGAAGGATGDPGADPVEGAWLLTGGLGGIGLALAGELARRGVKELVLLSRSGLPSRDEWPHWEAVQGISDPMVRRIAAVRALEDVASRVQVIAADVGDAEGVEAELAERLPGVRSLAGVIHAAGVLDDGPILAKGLEDAHRVLAPKVRGTHALSRALSGWSVGRTFLFSSRSATAGLPGQVDYTAANAFLDAWALARAGEKDGGAGVTSIAWDLWSETGMAFDQVHGRDVDGPTPLSIGAIEHPLFQYRLDLPEGEERFLARLDPGGPWMLRDHRLRGGPALVPGSGFVEFLHAALVLREGAGPVVLEEVLFLEPFIVPDGTTRDLAVRTRPGTQGRVLLSVIGREGPGSPWIEHVRALGGPGPAEPPAPVAIGKVLRGHRVRTIDVNGAPPSPILDFGPRWGSLRSVRFGDGEAVLELELPEAFRADLEGHPLHAALLDVATGSLPVLDAGAGAGGRDADTRSGVFIPGSYGSIRVHGPLSGHLLVHVRRAEDMGEDAVMFHVSVLDMEGRVLVSVEEFVMVRVDAKALADTGIRGPEGDASAPAPRAGAGIDLGRGLATSEGVEAFFRILEHPERPEQVIVSRGDPSEAPAPEPGRRGSPGDEAPVDVGPVVEALLQHPAVADATAVAHQFGGEAARLVAFVAYAPGRSATVSEIRRYLRGQVDEVLVPRNFVEVPEIPRDPRGRVDRSRLADPFAPRDHHVAPRTGSEELVAEVWRSLLGLDRVSIHDNFLDVGGHSLVGIRALIQIERRTGIRLHPNVLTLQTLEQIAAELDRTMDAGTPSGDSSPGEGGGGGGIASRILSAVRDSVSRS
jgi:acyl transferase domain-containing protein/NAD(P)-dependent dehydrogenase (short-subunit alcohol dehydrogenase family)